MSIILRHVYPVSASDAPSFAAAHLRRSQGVFASAIEHGTPVAITVQVVPADLMPETRERYDA